MFGSLLMIIMVNHGIFSSFIVDYNKSKSLWDHQPKGQNVPVVLASGWCKNRLSGLSSLARVKGDAFFPKIYSNLWLFTKWPHIARSSPIRSSSPLPARILFFWAPHLHNDDDIESFQFSSSPVCFRETFIKKLPSRWFCLGSRMRLFQNIPLEYLFRNVFFCVFAKQIISVRVVFCFVKMLHQPFRIKHSSSRCYGIITFITFLNLIKTEQQTF